MRRPLDIKKKKVRYNMLSYKIKTILQNGRPHFTRKGTKNNRSNWLFFINYTPGRKHDYSDDCHKIMGSISVYYHSRFKDIFIASLAIIAFCIYTYTGTEQTDNILGSIESIELIGVAIVYMHYGLGHQRSKLLNIQLSNIYWERNQILIESGKGAKDRMVNLSQEAKRILYIYFHNYMP